MSGKNLATASLVCGILSLVFTFFGYGALLGIIAGIAAIVLAVNSKKQGFEGGMRNAGLVLGIIGTVLCGITFVACALCMGACNAAVSSIESMY